MSNIYTSVEQLVGRTPLLELTKLEKEYNLEAKLFAKLEYLNPAGSAKDRIALKMLEDAEERGVINKDSVIIEPTSGNTGIGLAAMAGAKGYRVIIVMPDSMSAERRILMTAYGAELVLTEGAKGMKGAIEKAQMLAKEIPVFMTGNFSIALHDFIETLKFVAKRISVDTDVQIVEYHHNQKADAPSGTALMIRDALTLANNNLSAEKIHICSIRGGSIFGEHEVIFAGTDEVIEFKHTAYSKAVFAKGAVEAARFLAGKGAGRYDMSDVIQL